ncbi:MAG: hypothetical protein JSV65_12390 [Armatimonadota bacterium]|nr:MAG: hypothetical protein JSV65_12390 [Armatimonadota bacterium]
MTARPRRAKKKPPPFPSDEEIREALAGSGMRPFAVERALSQVLRPLRGDFGGRRKRRLYSVMAIRMGLVQLKEKVTEIARRHEKEAGAPLNADDFFFGPYKYLLIDYGPRDVENVIDEMSREGVLRRETRGGIEVLRATRKRSRSSAHALRGVLDQAKLHLGIRYAEEYDTERTYRV